MKSLMLETGLGSLVLLALGGVTACANTQNLPAVGSARDAHGCLPSAGYSWCTRTNRCERPWELAAQQGLAAGKDGFGAFCGQTMP
ncbi:MAG: hypothetical protein V4614_07285 [Pseudomonadota bacterium]